MSTECALAVENRDALKELKAAVAASSRAKSRVDAAITGARAIGIPWSVLAIHLGMTASGAFRIGCRLGLLGDIPSGPRSGAA